jgi:hypothetical protein
MKDMTLNRDQSGLTRRQLLGLATLTTAGLAAASVGVPQAKAVAKAGEPHEPIELAAVCAIISSPQPAAS